MAKKSKIAKNQKRIKMVEKYRIVREELKENRDYEGLAKLPKDSNPNRVRNRDILDGRPRGYMSKFGISRITFRDLAHQGKIPGIKKSSW